MTNTNNSIHHDSSICTQLNGSKYYNVILIIQFNIVICLRIGKWSQNNDWIFLFDS